MNPETVTQMPATNADELKARMTAAASGFGATCPECGTDVAPILLANWGACIPCAQA